MLKSLKNVLSEWIWKGRSEGLTSFSEEVEKGEKGGGYWYKPRKEKSSNQIGHVSLHPFSGESSQKDDECFLAGYVDNVNFPPQLWENFNIKLTQTGNKTNDLRNSSMVKIRKDGTAVVSSRGIVERVTLVEHPKLPGVNIKAVWSYQVAEINISIPSNVLATHLFRSVAHEVNSFSFIADSNGTVLEFNFVTVDGDVEKFYLIEEAPNLCEEKIYL